MIGIWTVTDPNNNPLSDSPGDTVTIDTMEVHSGMHALKIANGGFIGVAPPAAQFYGRMWVWLASNPSPGRGTGPHWGWILGDGMISGKAQEIRQGGQFGLLADNIENGIGTAVADDIVISDPNVFNDTDGGVAPPLMTWTCVEFYYGDNTLETWLDGVEVTGLDITPSTTWAHGTVAPWSPQYSMIKMGYAGYNGNSLTLWIDDVALDPNRIGCN